MDNQVKTYSLPIKNFTIENTDNEQFIKTKFFAISEGENLNRSSFELGGMEECVNLNDYTFKPILGSWNKNEMSEAGLGDFGGHDSDVGYDFESGEDYNTYLGEGSERPLGLILPNSAKIEDYKGKKWLTFEGLIWTLYNREAVKLLKKRKSNNVSVEVKVLDLEKDENGIEIIKKFSLLGITVIGVQPGIPEAHLNLVEFSATPQFSNFVKVFSSKISDLGEGTMEFIKKEQYGTGDKLDIDLSKDSASNDAWGPINKTKLRNDLLKAKNYKTLIPKSYLVVMDGWEDAPSEKLKYPVVQIKEGKVVLNINGVQTAGAYLMKEKDESYFKTAKAKLNKLRKVLGMERLMGIETNDDWGDEVEQNQPPIIKMEGGSVAEMDRKQLVDELSKRFGEKAELEKELLELTKSYEDKLGDYEYAEDDKKDAAKEEMEATKTLLNEKEEAMKTCEKAIVELSGELVKMEDDGDNDKDDVNDDDDVKIPDEDHKDGEPSKIDDEEEDYPIDTVGKDRYVSKLAEGCHYVSNSKNYVVFEKDGSLYVSKYACGEDGEVKMEEGIKCEKVYARFLVGGVHSPEEVAAVPVSVEITKGIESVYETIREKDARIVEIETEKAKDEELSAQYKVDVKSMLTKFEDLTASENVSKEYKAEVYSNIFDSKYSNVEDLELKVKASLYELNKGKFLSGSYAPNSEVQFNASDDEVTKINNFIKNYK